jgi:hypothetical protein
MARASLPPPRPLSPGWRNGPLRGLPLRCLWCNADSDRLHKHIRAGLAHENQVAPRTGREN